MTVSITLFGGFFGFQVDNTCQFKGQTGYNDITPFDVKYVANCY